MYSRMAVASHGHLSRGSFVSLPFVLRVFECTQKSQKLGPDAAVDMAVSRNSASVLRVSL